MNGTLQKFQAWRAANKAKGPNFKVELFICFMGQAVGAMFILQLVLSYLSAGFSPTDEEFLTQIKALDSSTFMAIAMAVVGYMKFKGTQSMLLALTALWSILLAISTQLLSLIPENMEIPSLDEWGVSAIYLPICTVFMSMIGVSVNLTLAVFQMADQRKEAAPNPNHK